MVARLDAVRDEQPSPLLRPAQQPGIVLPGAGKHHGCPLAVPRGRRDEQPAGRHVADHACSPAFQGWTANMTVTGVR